MSLLIFPALLTSKSLISHLHDNHQRVGVKHLILSPKERTYKTEQKEI